MGPSPYTCDKGTVKTMNGKERIGSKEGGDSSIFRKDINGEYYASLLKCLSDEIKKKRPHLAKKKVLLHQDNAPVHRSVVAIAKINIRICSNYNNMNKCHGSKKFANKEEVGSAVDGYFAELDRSHHKEGIEDIEHRGKKCIEVAEDYVEK